MNSVPIILQSRKNEEVLSYLAPLDCHSDIVAPLEEALSDFPDCQSFCPDPGKSRYCLWYVKDVVFAFAVGMQKVFLRYSPIDSTIFPGGVREFEFDGSSWFSFEYDIEYLDSVAKTSYLYAKSI